MIFYLATIMDKKELLELALKHNFGHCEVGVRMMALVDEIEQITIQRAFEQFKRGDCGGAHHAGR